MTETNKILKQEKISRLIELGNLAKQRHLDSGGDPHVAVGSLNQNETLTDKERTEYLDLTRQIFDDTEIEDFIRKTGTWQERFKRFKAEMKVEK
ncbi:hypothetical protein [Spirulina sp. 06S082]|uniref:hypothetical protein n=1 Tax=Spirulina sp. 06S082 TaxID=3110248 RepID=UPI002B203CED|nr:hypothetical protein [Spirulina sp. 06S082]MEA5467549.1 hypothetical protein [Spirulina sp. 06S082]